MDFALFIYPVDADIQASLGNEGGARYYKHLSSTIQQRFRAQGWRVVWLLHGEEHNPRRPDFSLISRDLPIFRDRFDTRPRANRRDDLILAAPLTYREALAGKRIEDVRVILDRLGFIEYLAICGFRDRREVERFAVAAHVFGIDALVNEDLTELGFSEAVLNASALHRSYPIVPFMCKPERERRITYAAEYAFREQRPYRLPIPAVRIIPPLHAA